MLQSELELAVEYWCSLFRLYYFLNIVIIKNINFKINSTQLDGMVRFLEIKEIPEITLRRRYQMTTTVDLTILSRECSKLNFKSFKDLNPFAGLFLLRGFGLPASDRISKMK